MVLHYRRQGSTFSKTCDFQYPLENMLSTTAPFRMGMHQKLLFKAFHSPNQTLTFEEWLQNLQMVQSIPDIEKFDSCNTPKHLDPTTLRVKSLNTKSKHYKTFQRSVFVCVTVDTIFSNKTCWWFQIFFIFTPILGKWSNLTNIFQMGWNHQLEKHHY